MSSHSTPSPSRMGPGRVTTGDSHAITSGDASFPSCRSCCVEMAGEGSDEVACIAAPDLCVKCCAKAAHDEQHTACNGDCAQLARLWAEDERFFEDLRDGTAA